MSAEGTSLVGGGGGGGGGPGVTQECFVQEGSATRSNPLPFHNVYTPCI